jgi:tol-pal system protein YbgF
MAGMFAITATAYLALAPVSALAQSGDAEMRVQQLEEQLRQLNGRVEEMSFQLLQMQETIRKAQEDNEFRFQELEGGAPKKKSSVETIPGDPNNVATASGETTPEATGDDAAALDQPIDGGAETADPNGRQAVDLGKLKFDENGNVIDNSGDAAAVAGQSDLPPPDTGTVDETAALKSGEDTQYKAAYDSVLSGDYPAAEQGFQAFISANPGSKRISDANFWLGEAQYSQAKYGDAAKTFLNGYKTYGSSPKAPEMLLKLAMSLAALDSKDTACATLRQVTKAYPKASRAIISKVASEQKRLSC